MPSKERKPEEIIGKPRPSPFAILYSSFDAWIVAPGPDIGNRAVTDTLNTP